jgi:hypothetical protein
MSNDRLITFFAPFWSIFERDRQVLLIFVSVSRMLLTSLVQYWDNRVFHGLYARATRDSDEAIIDTLRVNTIGPRPRNGEKLPSCYIPGTICSRHARSTRAANLNIPENRS